MAKKKTNNGDPVMNPSFLDEMGSDAALIDSTLSQKNEEEDPFQSVSQSDLDDGGFDGELYGLQYGNENSIGDNGDYAELFASYGPSTKTPSSMKAFKSSSDPAPLPYKVAPLPEIKTVVFGGKQYKDVTPYFLETPQQDLFSKNHGDIDVLSSAMSGSNPSLLI